MSDVLTTPTTDDLLAGDERMQHLVCCMADTSPGIPHRTLCGLDLDTKVPESRPMCVVCREIGANNPMLPCPDGHPCFFEKHLSEEFV